MVLELRHAVGLALYFLFQICYHLFVGDLYLFLLLGYQLERTCKFVNFELVLPVDLLQLWYFRLEFNFLGCEVGGEQAIGKLQFGDVFVQFVDFLIFLLEEGVGLLISHQPFLERIDLVFLHCLEFPHLHNLILEFQFLQSYPLQIGFLRIDKMPQLHVFLLDTPAIIFFLLFDGFFNFGQLCFIFGFLKEIFDGSLVVSLQLGYVLQSSVVFNEQFEQMLEEGLEEIEIVLLHHPEEMFFLHLAYLLALPIQSHLHSMPQRSEIFGSELNETGVAHGLGLLDGGGYHELVEVGSEIWYILQSEFKKGDMAVRVEWKRWGLKKSWTDL